MKKIALAALVAAFAFNLNASPLDNIQIPTDASRLKSLNGKWSFKFIDGPDWSEYKDFYAPGFKYSSWDKIPVPGCWDAMGILPPKYAHPEDVTGLYRTTFKVPSSWKGQHVYINLDGVLRGYELWINGRKAGQWELANNSAQFDITEFVKTGTNDLAIRVYTRYKGYEFDGNDDWGQVGIHRNITLFAVPETHIKDFNLTSKVALDGSASVSFRFDVDAYGSEVSDAVVKARILAPDGSVAKVFECAATPSCEYVWDVEKPLLWTAETPSLYRLECSLVKKGRIIEKMDRKFGIREIRIDGAKLLLNNRLFKLRGVTMHATDPYNGKVISDDLTLKDMKMMKEANVNFIRTSHYPREPRFYDLCDSLGFYVMDEVPFGYGDEHLTDESYQDNLILRAQATVVRDKNRACVLIWSIGNENNLTPICQVTGKYVQKLDPSRPICYPMIGSYFNRFNFDLPDFLDIYAPHYPNTATLKRYAAQSTKPLIATEYCHTLGQAFEDNNNQWETMQANDNLAGGAVWEWVDQGMPDSESKFEGRFAKTIGVWRSEDDVIQMAADQGTDGIVYATRDPLPNYFNLRKNYAQAYVLTKGPLSPSRQMPQRPQGAPAGQPQPGAPAGQPGPQMGGGRPGPGGPMEDAKSVYRVEVQNRYDFVDFSDKIICNWTISADGKTVVSGSLNPSCAPHETCTLEFPAELGERLGSEICYLNLNFVDKTNGLALNEDSFLLNSKSQYARILAGLADGAVSGKASEMIQGSPLWRTGRKTTMAEDRVHAKDNLLVSNYLMKGSFGSDGRATFDNGEIRYDGTLRTTAASDGSLTYDFNMIPADGSRRLLLESGLALLLDKDIRYAQWIGQGPYATYPFKYTSNIPGVHSLEAGDLYFEGSRLGVDALLCTDAEGNGLMFISNVTNINLEETDRGLVVSFDPVISGIGTKSGSTMDPQYSDNVGAVSGQVKVIPVKAGSWNAAMTSLFKAPSAIARYSPFIAVYDTYLRKFDEICK